jgi:hypothetical protein
MSTLGKAATYFIRVLRVVLGLGLVALFVWALGDQKYTNENYGKAIAILEEGATRGIPTIRADRVEPAYEGDFVHIQGNLRIGNVYDPLTGLALRAIGMTRTIEMLQWKQERHRRKGQKELGYRWNKVWSDRIIDSDSFTRVETYFEENRDNPENFPHDQQLALHTTSLTLGGWPLAITFADRLITSEVVPPQILQAADLADGWHASGDGAYLYPPQNANTMTTDTVGAIRVRYSYTPLDEGAYSAVGIVRDGTLVDHLYERVYSVPLMAPGNVSAEELVNQTLEVLAGGQAPQKNWIGYVFVGLLLCIGVLARLFPFLRGFTEAPFPKRAIITIAVAAVGTAIAGVIA